MTATFVTGVPGWLGTRVVETLLEGLPDGPVGLGGEADRTVTALCFGGEDPRLKGRFAGRLKMVVGDVRDRAGLDAAMVGLKGGTVFHAAGIIHPVKSVKEWDEVNVQGTKNVLEAAIAAGARRFVHVSSNSPIGCNPTPDHRFDESSPYNPYLGYGISKKAGEDLVNEAGRSGRIEVVIIRPPWFYGVGQPPRQSEFFGMVKAGKGPLVGPGNNRRSMAYVDNICQGLLLCEKVDAAKGNTYWIADRDAYAMTEIMDTIESVIEQDFGYTVAHKRTWLWGILGQIAEFVDRALQAVGLYHQKIHVAGELNKNIACTIAKAERELGYDPKVALREGMRRSIQDLHDRGIKL